MDRRKKHITYIYIYINMPKKVGCRELASSQELSIGRVFEIPHKSSERPISFRVIAFYDPGSRHYGRVCLEFRKDYFAGNTDTELAMFVAARMIEQGYDSKEHSQHREDVLAYLTILSEIKDYIKAVLSPHSAAAASPRVTARSAFRARGGKRYLSKEAAKLRLRKTRRKGRR